MNRVSSVLASGTRGNVARSVARRKSRSLATPPEHDLVLFDYEASPWCRLVREYLTILDLKVQIHPCPRQTLFLEGAFDKTSRFRPEAMGYLKTTYPTDDLTFPLLVDRTKSKETPVVIKESYAIIEHLWENYGKGIELGQDRPDKWWNSPSLPFVVRFLSLAGPSYCRPFPSCGILQTPSIWNAADGQELVLFQSEACPESRLVRETLCTLEVPYLSVAAAVGSFNLSLMGTDCPIPVLKDGEHHCYGASECTSHLWDTYKDPNRRPNLWRSISSEENLGRSGSFGVGAYTAFLQGNRAFVPQQAMD